MNGEGNVGVELKYPPRRVTAKVNSAPEYSDLRGPGGIATVRQAEIYAFIAGRYRETGIPVTIREVMNWFGLKSVNSVLCHVRSLRKKGLLEDRLTGGGHKILVPAQVQGHCRCCGRRFARGASL